MQLIKINYYVMPDLISLPRQLVSRGHPVYIALPFLDSGFRRNDKSLRDNGKLSSPKGEGFQPSPKGTLMGSARQRVGGQGFKGSSELKNEYRILNKEFRIMKFPSTFVIPCSIFCGSI